MTTTMKPLSPTIQKFVDLLKSGTFTQKELIKRTGHSPKSISNLISTVHNRPGMVISKDHRGIPGFKRDRNGEGQYTYTIEGKMKEPKGKVVKSTGTTHLESLIKT